jgi:hypothetical protein
MAARSGRALTREEAIQRVKKLYRKRRLAQQEMNAIDQELSGLRFSAGISNKEFAEARRSC